MKKLLSILFLLGCSNLSYYKTNSPPQTQTKHIPVYIDTSLSTDYKNGINDAIIEWNKTLNNYIVFDVASYSFDMDIDVIEAVYKNDNGILILNNDDHINDDVLAWSSIKGHTIHILSNKIKNRNKNINKITKHEIGHILGLPDLDKQGSLMNRDTNLENNCIDQFTLTKLITIYNFDLSKMNYCIIP